jgi:predicted phosphodiesterase
MRVLLIADIHSNLTAMERVLQDAEDKGGFDVVWCLGDIVGYGPDPGQCIRKVRDMDAACIAGNHDLAAVGKIPTGYFNFEAAEAVWWTRQQLSKDDVAYLEGLELVRVEGDFTLVHGSPRDPVWTYIFSVAEAQENLRYFQTAACLVGHTHVPMYFESAKYPYMVHPEDGQRIDINKNRWLINPGGVGQPRDGNPKAAYAVIETEIPSVTFHRVDYDFKSVQDRMKQAGFPEGLIYRLSKGH